MTDWAPAHTLFVFPQPGGTISVAPAPVAQPGYEQQQPIQQPMQQPMQQPVGGYAVPHRGKSKVVAAQLDSVFGSLPIRAVKTGMLYSRPIIDAVSDRLAKCKRLQLVIDPVMLSSSGTPLLRPSAAQALAKRLLPLAMLVTPNLDEAAALAKRRAKSMSGAVTNTTAKSPGTLMRLS